jgi:glutathione S-transferase
MITLFQGPPAFGLPNLSPFCTKVELYLKLTGLPYKTAIADPRKGPKGKIPWIDDDGQIVADSSFIFEYLRKKYGDKLDGGLTQAQLVIALTARRMIEEHLYFAAIQMRWGEDEIFAEVRKTFANLIPAPLRGIITNKIRKATLAKLHEQGIGRHKPAEIYELGNQDLDALCSLLGTDQYFFSQTQPTSFDCTAWAFLAMIHATPGKTALQEHLRSRQNLVDYIGRIGKRYFT